MTTMRGVAEFHSETGTEGGWWAFQDEKFMGIPSDDLKCAKCGVYPKTMYYDYTTDLDKQREWVERYDAEREENEKTDKKVSEMFGLTLDRRRPCEPGTHEWVLAYPQGTWSYEGLHILENGDYFKIFDKDDPARVVWAGEIRLKDLGLFTDDAFGYWIHNDQIGMDRETWARWFIEGWPTEFTPTPLRDAAERLRLHLLEEQKEHSDGKYMPFASVSIDADLNLVAYMPDNGATLPTEWEGHPVKEHVRGGA